MTARVVLENTGKKAVIASPALSQPVGDKWVMAFVSPSSYTLKSLPRPPDDKLEIRTASGESRSHAADRL